MLTLLEFSYLDQLRFEIILFFIITSCVADPDPHVFGPPGSGSNSQMYGSGSFYHHAKK
jgi:hypothetical protein